MKSLSKRSLRDDGPSAGPLADGFPANEDHSSGRRASGIVPGYISGRAALGRYLGVSPRTVSRLMNQGVIPHIGISHRLGLFRKVDGDRALTSLLA
jgi:hypothetical protein